MPDSRELEGKVAIVTGAARGMGRAVAERLSAAGAGLVINDLDADGAKRTADDLSKSGGEAISVQGDVTVAADVRRIVDATLDRFLDIHILVNNAGVLRPTPVIDIEEDEWDLTRRLARRHLQAGIVPAAGPIQPASPNRNTPLRERRTSYPSSLYLSEPVL